MYSKQFGEGMKKAGYIPQIVLKNFSDHDVKLLQRVYNRSRSALYRWRDSIHKPPVLLPVVNYAGASVELALTIRLLPAKDLSSTAAVYLLTATDTANGNSYFALTTACDSTNLKIFASYLLRCCGQNKQRIHFLSVEESKAVLKRELIYSPDDAYERLTEYLQDQQLIVSPLLIPDLLKALLAIQIQQNTLAIAPQTVLPLHAGIHHLKNLLSFKQLKAEWPRIISAEYRTAQLDTALQIVAAAANEADRACNISIALDYYQKITEVAKTNPELQQHQLNALLALVKIHLKAADYDRAEQTCQQIAELAPQLPELYYWQARLKIAQNEEEAAKNFLLQAEKLFSLQKNHEAESRCYAIYGELSQLLNNLKKAIYYFKKMQKHAATHSLPLAEYEACGFLGLVYHAKRNYQTAECWYRRGLDLANGQGDEFRAGLSVHNLALCFNDQGRYQEAELCSKASLPPIIKAGDRELVCSSLLLSADLAHTQGDLKRAMEGYLQLLHRYPDFYHPNRPAVDLYIRLADIYRLQAKFKKAATQLKLAAKFNTNSALTPYLEARLGDLYRDGKNFTSALTCYKKAYKLIDGKSEFLKLKAFVTINLGKLYLQKGECKKAREFLTVSRNTFIHLNMRNRDTAYAAKIAEIKTILKGL